MNLANIKLKNWHMVEHMNLVKKHFLKKEGTIDCPAIPTLHGQTLCEETITPYRKGKPGIPKISYYLASTPKTAFDSPQLLVAHYTT
jgi:hypothetical protein